MLCYDDGTPGYSRLRKAELGLGLGWDCLVSTGRLTHSYAKVSYEAHSHSHYHCEAHSYLHSECEAHSHLHYHSEAHSRIYVNLTCVASKLCSMLGPSSTIDPLSLPSNLFEAILCLLYIVVD